MSHIGCLEALRSTLNLIQQVSESSRLEVMNRRANVSEIVRILRDENFVIESKNELPIDKKKHP